MFKTICFINIFFLFKDAESGSQKVNQSQIQCLPQRAALLKSILNFLKKAIPDAAFVESTRSLMDENLQNALKMIISNAEYYGALLFLLGKLSLLTCLKFYFLAVYFYFFFKIKFIAFYSNFNCYLIFPSEVVKFLNY